VRGRARIASSMKRTESVFSISLLTASFSSDRARARRKRA
jgi:hypothetical protein